MENFQAQYFLSLPPPKFTNNLTAFSAGSLRPKPLFLQVMSLLGIFFLMLFVAQLLSFAFLYVFFGLRLEQMASLLTSVTSTGTMALKFMQIIQGLITFIGSALIFSYFMKRPGEDYLRIRKSITAVLVVLVFFLVIVSQPLISWLGIENSKMVFPSFLKGLEQAIRDSEETLGRVTDRLLQTHNPSDLVINLVMIAVIPAIGEELIFRSCLQQTLIAGLKRHHLAIFLTAAIFSAIHFQFYGFMPRFLLGLVLGYLFYWSSSIWLSATAHLVNNGLAVLAFASHYSGTKSNAVPQAEKMPAWWLVVLSILLTVLLLYGLKKAVVRNEAGVASRI